MDHYNASAAGPVSEENLPAPFTALNEEQQAAVTATEGFIRVIAGAGSGKTRALTHRFAFLVDTLGILPENILCVTFTNKAANEMRQRIHDLIGDQDTGYINTFHGFCVSVLQEDSYAVAYPKSFLVLDNSDIDAMLSIIYEERGLTLRDKPFSYARNMIEEQKLFRKPEYYLEVIADSLEVLHQKYLSCTDTDEIIFYGYLYQQKKCFGLDYNDLIKFTLYIFSENPDIRLKWQERLEYIMIDEYQDIDGLQYALMSTLCQYHKNLFIVGDPDQTIYTWRGANVRYLLDFESHFPGTRTIRLLKNYRSSPEILHAANSLIDKNQNRIKKDLIPTCPESGPVLFHYAKDQTAEAVWIAEELQKLHEQGIPYRDITILYRAHYVSRSIEDALLKEQIPYTIYSGVPFFSRIEIKDALSYLRMVIMQDDLSFRRISNVPKRNLGMRRQKYLEEYAEKHGTTLYQALKQTLEDDIFKGTRAADFIRLIEEHAALRDTMPVSDLLSSLLDKSGYELLLRTEGSQERLDNLAELKNAVREYENTCGEEADAEHYLRHVALFTGSDMEEHQDKVKLMTVHAAKGLEFPYVFLAAMNEGIFPSRKTRDLNGMEEERRLAFVALTRAEKGLRLSGARGRNLDGSPRYPSRFVLDIDPGLLTWTVPMDEGLIRETRAYIRSQEARMPEALAATVFPAGARISHSFLGEGTVLEVDMDKSAYLIRFDRMDTARRISFRIPLKGLD